MSFGLNRVKSKIANILSAQVEGLRFPIGQSAVIASRAASNDFINLWDAEVKVYSQWGEDGILDYLCERLGLAKPKVIEIGAGNFTECNSRFLAENRNASVFAVDGRDDLIASIELDSLRWKTHIYGYRTWVTPENINEILEKAGQAIGNPDVFSLDLDGNDYWILQAANLDSVSVVVVEYNPLFGHNKAVTVAREDTFERTSKHYSWLYYGASIKAFVDLLQNKDFVFVGTNRVGNNAFFVRKKLRNQISLEVSADLSKYTDWRIREARSQDGRLSFASGYNRVSEIKNLPLVDLETGLEISVGAANPAC
jgi:hypothetical protein